LTETFLITLVDLVILIFVKTELINASIYRQGDSPNEVFPGIGNPQEENSQTLRSPDEGNPQSKMQVGAGII